MGVADRTPPDDRARRCVARRPADEWPDGREWPDGWHVTHVPVTGSTNDDLLAAAATGAPDRSVLVADHQTAGRGRLDRRWEAPPGANLLVSILFRTVPSPPSTLTQRVGLAAIDARRAAAGVDAVLKWPNDLLVGERKLAGILAQRAADGSIVVGLGLNVGWAPGAQRRCTSPRRCTAQRRCAGAASASGGPTPHGRARRAALACSMPSAIAFQGVVEVRACQVLDGCQRVALGIAARAHAGHQADIHARAEAT